MLILETSRKYLEYFHIIFCLMDKIMLSDNVYSGKGPTANRMITLSVTYLCSEPEAVSIHYLEAVTWG